ncbi:hypothetical protein [Promicromonospora sp. NFX87]|uniref:hypothetical protein n=1 Tax=Promicromonospora sp. NFX87 TaxID=3402691 RepID=UPI003AFA77F6
MTTELPLISRLRDIADLHHARQQIRPLVDEVVQDLSTDPLGTNLTPARLIALGEVLSSPRAAGSRAARARVEDLLQSSAVEET